MKKMLLLLVLGYLAVPLFSQDVSTQGTEFWVSFMGNGYKYHPQYGTWLRLQLLISAKDACNCTIKNPQTGWMETFSIEANSYHLVEDINWQQAYMDMNEYEVVKNKGLLITTTDTVSVYCANIAANSFDVSYVMPIEGLSDDYLIQTYDQSSYDVTHTSSFLIVATENNTEIDITPSVTTYGNKPAGQQFTVTLNRGQTYQVRSSYSLWGSGFDLSGSRVTAREGKKIAVFNGNNLTKVPTNAYSDADCIFEQAMPIHSWGKKFIVTASKDRTLDYVKITSAVDGNVVTKNGEQLCTLDAGQSHVFSITNNEKSCFLESTSSCAVYLYNNSSNNIGNGAPSMVWIAPIEQRIDEITFSTFNYEHPNVNIDNHYVNVILNANDCQSIYLDHELVPPSMFETVNGNPDYVFFRKQIEHGVHYLSCANGFNAHVYGFGSNRGYAYMVGSKAADLSATVLVDDEITHHHDTISNCSLATMTFDVETNSQEYEIAWDFGDGTTSHEAPVTHTFPEHDLYQVTATIFSAEALQPSTTMVFFIDTRHMQDLYYSDNACIGQVYSGYGFENVTILHDTTLVREEINAINPNCSHFVYLDISAYYFADTTIHAWTCFTKPNVYTQYGFNLPYDKPGTYIDSISIELAQGCDSITRLILEVGEIQPSIVNTDSIESPHYPITATEFNVNSYTFCVIDEISDTATWDFSQCEWTISKESWRISPSNDNHCCTVYPMDWVEDTVWLSFKVASPCDDTIIRYWLKPSFFSIEENTPQPIDLIIIPNPNNGQMELRFEHLIGNAEIKVYDMRGMLIDQFKTQIDSETSNVYYEIRNHSAGLYFIVATVQENILRRKVIIGRQAHP